MGSRTQLRPPPTVVGGPGIAPAPTPGLTLDPQFDLDPSLLGNEAYLHLSGLGGPPKVTGLPRIDAPTGVRPPFTQGPDPMWRDRLPPPIPDQDVPRPADTQPTERPPQQDSAGFKGKTIDPRKIPKPLRGGAPP